MKISSGTLPLTAAASGAAFISSSAVLVRLSQALPVEAAFLRCAFALPVLVLVDLFWRHRCAGNRMSRKSVWLARAAGVAFGADLIFWAYCIQQVGAGLATVLGNLQVIFVAVLSFLLFGERYSRRFLFALLMMVGGVVLVAGVLEESPYGRDPLLGTGFGIATSVLYAVFLIGFRVATRGDDASSVGIVEPLLHATTGATAACGGAILISGFDPPAVEGVLWLAALAVVSQVVGWLLISNALPHLGSTLTSAVLLSQPVGAMLMSYALFEEEPSMLQLIGVALVLLGLTLAAAPTRGKRVA